MHFVFVSMAQNSMDLARLQDFCAYKIIAIKINSILSDKITMGLCLTFEC